MNYEKLEIKDLLVNIAESEARMVNLDRGLKSELENHKEAVNDNNDDNNEEKD